MELDIALQAMERMRLEDPVRFNRLVQEGMAQELGIIGFDDRNEADVEELKSMFFPQNRDYAEVSQAVLDGKRSVVEEKINRLIGQGMDPVDLVTHALMPGIQVQCEMYDLGKSYVPEILMSNDAMQGGIRLCQAKVGDVPSRGTVVSFVAEGDLHDIGKNICAAILKANGFNVIDIGRDVPKEKVLQIVTENDAKLVCGSTLMSTTKPGLVDTALLLELKKIGVPVACGGAAVSRAFVDTFTNSLYTKTPLETVKAAGEICTGQKAWKDFR